MTSVGDQYLTLRSFLGSEFLDTPDAQDANSPASQARMGRLNPQQFAVFTIDLIDEILRRREAPTSLPARQDFHPKRNQTRAKLASLSIVNFKKMAADVFFELERRFPNLTQEVTPTSVMKSTGPQLLIAFQQYPPSKDRPISIVDARQPNRISLVDTPSAAAPPPRIPARNIDDLMNDLGSLMSQPARSVAPSSIKESTETGATSVLRDAMERMRKDHQAKAEQFQARIADLEAEAAKSSTLIQNAKQAEASATSELEEAKEEIKQLKEELSTSRRDVTELRKDLSQSRKELSDAVSEAASVRTEMSLMRQAQQAQSQSNQGHKKEIAELQKAVSDAQSDADKQRREADQLRLEVANLKNQNSKQLADYVSLKADYADIKSHISDQQVLFGEVRTETTSLLAEVKSLMTKNQELRTTNESLAAKNEEGVKVADELAQQYDQIVRDFEELKSENESLREQLSNRVVGSGNGRKSMLLSGRSQAAPAMPVIQPLAHEGVLDMNVARAYQGAVESLLKAIRSDPNTVLQALKQTLSAAKQVTEGIEEFEVTHYRANTPFSSEDKLDAARANFSSILASVISASKAYIGRSGSIDMVDLAVANLSLSIAGIARLVRAKCDGLNDLDAAEVATIATGMDDDVENGIYQQIQELKEFVEGQTTSIVEDIQNLLNVMRNQATAPASLSMEVSGIVNSVSSVVKNVLKAAHVVFSKMREDDQFKIDCEVVLNEMAKTRRRLEGSVAEIGAGQKEARQMIGATAFELAKQVKKLVSLLDAV
ncbi:component of the polarisome [Entophlyctis luteolus]|nr:component of the polarisome [Entophlyctis luteolus]KAJ3380199.1 component of the polarisome [Entophlyctis sp. JEL0112]